MSKNLMEVLASIAEAIEKAKKQEFCFMLNVGELSSIEAAKKLGLNVAHICSVLHNRVKHTRGYYFKYNGKEKQQQRCY